MLDSNVDLTAPRLPCRVCNGDAVIHHAAFDSVPDEVTGKVTHYPDRDYPCNACEGFGYFTPPDMNDIAKRIRTTRASKGKPAGSFRASMVSPSIGRNPSEAERREMVMAERAYYVWRLARFHGGADVTMPMTADLFSRGDPYKPLLESMADAVAVKVFGSSMRGAGRWANALLGSEDAAKFHAAHPEADPLAAFLNG